MDNLFDTESPDELYNLSEGVHTFYNSPILVDNGPPDQAIDWVSKMHLTVDDAPSQAQETGRFRDTYDIE